MQAHCNSKAVCSDGVGACESGMPDQNMAEASVDRKVPTQEPHSQLPCYIIVHNVSKRHNLGMIARSATAFGVAEVC